MTQALYLKVICYLQNEALSSKALFMVTYLRLDGDPLLCRVFQNRNINDDVLILPVGFQPKILLHRILAIMNVVAGECYVE